MDIEFDPAKDAVNLSKHNVSLALGAEMDLATAFVVEDIRGDHGERRFNALGLIAARVFAITFTYRTAIRIISLRKANDREARRYTEHVLPETDKGVTDDPE
jgi:uncharacterized DUF497 family protein